MDLSTSLMAGTVAPSGDLATSRPGVDRAVRWLTTETKRPLRNAALQEGRAPPA